MRFCFKIFSSRAYFEIFIHYRTAGTGDNVGEKAKRERLPRSRTSFSEGPKGAETHTNTRLSRFSAPKIIHERFRSCSKIKSHTWTILLGFVVRKHSRRPRPDPDRDVERPGVRSNRRKSKNQFWLNVKNVTVCSTFSSRNSIFRCLCRYPRT